MRSRDITNFIIMDYLCMPISVRELRSSILAKPSQAKPRYLKVTDVPNKFGNFVEFKYVLPQFAIAGERGAITAEFIQGQVQLCRYLLTYCVNTYQEKEQANESTHPTSIIQSIK